MQLIRHLRTWCLRTFSRGLTPLPPCGFPFLSCCLPYFLSGKSRPRTHASRNNGSWRIAAALTKRQGGIAAIEFLVVALALLLAGMGAFEASRWYMTREALGLALLQAARAGSVRHARPQAIEDAFLDGLTVLYAPPGRFPTARARMEDTLTRFERDNDRLAWEIDILHPNAAEYADFMQKNLPIAIESGNPAINNNYQFEQHQHMPQGRFSGSTIYEANTLQLQLVYLYQPVVPGMKGILRKAMRAIGDKDSLMSTLGVVPIRTGISIEMHSHPVLWMSKQTRHVRYLRQNPLITDAGYRRERIAIPTSQGHIENAAAKTSATPLAHTAGIATGAENTETTAASGMTEKSAMPETADIADNAGHSQANNSVTQSSGLVAESDPQMLLPQDPACE